MKLDVQHIAILIAAVLSAVGPTIVAQLSPSTVAAVASYLGPVLSLLTTVLALFKTPPVSLPAPKVCP